MGTILLKLILLLYFTNSVADEFKNSTIANFVVRPEVGDKKKPMFQFSPHFDHSSYSFMVPEGMNNQESSVAMVQFYGVLTEPNLEFEFVGENNDWFKIGAIETVKEPNYMVLTVPILIKKNVDVVYQKKNQGMYSFKISKKNDPKIAADINVEVLSFAPMVEAPVVDSKKPLQTVTSEPHVLQTLTTDVIETTPILLTKETKMMAITKDEKTTQTPILAEKATTEKMMFSMKTNDLELPPIDLEIVNVKSQLSITKIQYVVGEKLTLANYEIRVHLNETVSTEMIEMKIEPQQFFEIRPRFILNGIPAQIRIKTLEKIDAIKEVQVFATYADVDSDTISALTVDFEIKNMSNPFFNHSTFEFIVPENSESGVIVGEVHATDPTKNDDSGLIYSLIGRSNELFLVDQGQIRHVCSLNSSCLDYETQKAYYFVLIATTLSGLSSDPVTITINVADVNDNVPLLRFPEETVKIINGRILDPFSIMIYDKDSDEVNSNSIVFQGSAADFLSPKKINDKTFETEFKKLPEIGGYVLNFFSEDSSNPQLKSEVKTVKIEVLDNSGKAKFSQIKYEIRVEKLQPKTSLVHPKFDGQPLETVRFTFLDTNPGWITVDESSGNVYVDELPKNGIAAGIYNIKMGAVNRETNKIIDKCEISIVIDGSQKQTSIFKQKIFSFNLEEPFKDLVFLPLNDETKKFSIIADSVFAFDEFSKIQDSWSSIAKIVTNFVFISKNNLERSRIIQFQLSADDNPNDRALVTINIIENVQKYNEKKVKMSKPLFSSPWTGENQKISIKLVEEAPLGYAILHLFAYNPENGEINKNVSLKGENAEYFIYDATNQRLLTNQLIDYETLSSKTLNIDLIASDQSSKTVAHIEVQIQNVNDNSPKILQADGKEFESDVVLNFVENASPGMELLKVLIQDKDDENDNFTANLLGEAVKNYQLKILNNSITILTSPECDFDYESHPHQTLLLVVLDNAGSKDVLPIHVYLNNTNDVRPHFEITDKNIVIVDNWPIGAVVGKICAVDEDSEELSFFISGSAAKFLSINEKTGELFTTVPLTGFSSFEPYSLLVKVSDNGVPSFTATMEMEIQVDDVASMDENNVESFRFSNPKVDYVLNIPENTPVNTRLLTAEVVNGVGSPIDVDYYLVPVSLDDENWLSINSKTGDIYVDKELDYEKAPFITVVIVASALQQQKYRNISQLFRISVQNMDDVAPKFAYRPKNSAFSLILDDDTTNLPENRSVGKLQAIDADSSPFNKVYYYLLPYEEETKLFHLDSETGELFKRQNSDNFITSFDLCALASSDPILKPEQLKEIECDTKNSSMLQFKVRKLSTLMDLTHQKNGKIVAKNNSVINIDVDDYKIPFNQKNDEMDSVFLYKLQNVQFFPLMKNLKYNQAIPERNIFVVPNTGKIQVDPEIIEGPEGIYSVQIKAFFVKTGEYADNFVSQIHKINPENKLKFVFNEDLKNFGLKMDDFKQNLEKIIQSRESTNDMKIVFSTLKSYGKKRGQSFACFHFARSNKIVSKSEAVNVTSTQLNINNHLSDLYQQFNVINIDNCQVDSEKLTAQIQFIPKTLFWIVGLSTGFLILLCLVCHICFVTRYKDHLRQQKNKIEYEQPIHDPFMIPQFIDPRKL